MDAIMRRQRTRLAEIVTYARANSPYYRKLYQNLPERIEDPALLPVTSKKMLMPCFDDWVTDREVSIAPLVFGSLIDGLPGIELFQMVQTAPTSLRLRLQFEAGAGSDRVWQQVQTEVMRLLTEYKVGHITLERAEEPPLQSPGGKYRSIIPLS